MTNPYIGFASTLIVALLGWIAERIDGIEKLTPEWRQTIMERASAGDRDALYGLSAADLAELLPRIPAAIDSGPLVGAVDADSARIWVHTDREAAVALIVEKAAGGAAARESAMRTSRSQFLTATFLVDHLEPDTAYRYRVTCDGMRSIAWAGEFRTAPKNGASGRFTMTFASCMDKWGDDVQPCWYMAAALSPSFHLLLGDNAYANSTDPLVQVAAHLRQRSVESFAAFVRRTPTFAVWDDHDFGDDDCDGTNPKKFEDLDAFRRFFPNPAGGLPGCPGVFFSFRWGDVEFFMLDSRFHRSPDSAPNDERKRLLGDGQFLWLSRALAASDAKFKMIACGSPLIDSADDSWRSYDFERERLFRFIRKRAISGVMFLTGDTHFCAVRTYPAESTLGYPLIEVISSGIGRREEGHPLEREADGHPALPSIEPVPTYRQGFASLEFDTAAADPALRVRIHQRGALVPFDRTYRLSELDGSAAGKPRAAR